MDNNLKIVTVKEILKDELSIPSYQRPYKWSKESALRLVEDTYSAFMNQIPEYRIGSVVLHYDSGKFNIVDGQQRLTTLAIIVYCFKDRMISGYNQLSKLLDAEYNELSIDAIVNNYDVISRKVKEMSDEYISYLLDKCTIVRIVTHSEQEAFQFFDSQNSRGKALSPHDLLKSYHLREMNDESETDKFNIINKWESTNQKELAILFEEHLYPLVRWYKNKDGLHYSSKNIGTFKGIKKDNKYNYSIYNRAANLYIERFNTEGMYELASCSQLNQFQLMQPLIAGKRFFQYTLYYYKLHEEIESLISFKFSEEEIPKKREGDIYVRNLFVNVVMFYVDKFNIDALTDARLNLLYKWAYSLRIVLNAVYKESVNKYAQGRGDRINTDINMFALISEMQEPSELDTIILGKVDRNSSNNKNNYEQILNKIGGIN